MDIQTRLNLFTEEQVIRSNYQLHPGYVGADAEHLYLRVNWNRDTLRGHMPDFCPDPKMIDRLSEQQLLVSVNCDGVVHLFVKQ
jgi:hypothetical protein